MTTKDRLEQFVDLTPAGKNLKCRCPFHDEKTPSFVISEDLSKYHCFGCGRSGNVDELVEMLEDRL